MSVPCIMTEQQTNEPLDTLQDMLNNVLVETGKALRAARKDGRGPNAPARDTPARMTESIRTFHQALDSLEQDIVSAKSVLQRDLKQMREKNGQVSTPQIETAQPAASPSQITQPPMPQPVDAQTKSPMVIDLESSPPTNGSPMLIKSEAGTGASKPVANMNGNMNGMANETISHASLPIPAPEPMPSTMSQQAPAAVMEVDGAAGGGDSTFTESMHNNTNHNISIMDGGNNELNFTNMTFAPPNEEAPMSTNPSDQTFDMSNFAPADGNNDMMPLDNSTFMSNSNGQANVNANNAGGQAQDSNDNTNTGGNGGNSLDNFDWSLNNTDGGGDGLDFDFSIDGEDTFNTLMNERDGEFSMDQGGFDADPFNMGKPDGT